MAYLDFLILVAGCEARLEQRPKALEGGIWLG